MRGQVTGQTPGPLSLSLLLLQLGWRPPSPGESTRASPALPSQIPGGHLFLGQASLHQPDRAAGFQVAWDGIQMRFQDLKSFLSFPHGSEVCRIAESRAGMGKSVLCGGGTYCLRHGLWSCKYLGKQIRIQITANTSCAIQISDTALGSLSFLVCKMGTPMLGLQ